MKLPNMKTVLKHYDEIKGIHEAADFFPLPTEAEFGELVKDVGENGLFDPVLLSPEGLLIDGRSRLLACYEAKIEVLFETVSEFADPWTIAWSRSKHKNFTVGQKAAIGQKMMPEIQKRAKERQKLSKGQGIKGQVNSPDLNGKQARDEAAKLVGVGGSSIDAIGIVAEHAPDLFGKVFTGEMMLNKACTEAKKSTSWKKLQEEKAELKATANSKKETTNIITVDGETKKIALPKVTKFNRTNGNVEWASWTWNPVTGCNHDCTFCYAREIANLEKMKTLYPFGFSPAFREYMLEAPSNTQLPKSNDPRDGRVFVCSMADLFGKWVPKEWITKVFDSCLAAPDWEYLFLTKWPRRYSTMPLLEGAWYGASITQQKDVRRVEKAMQCFDTPGCIKWVSMEPLLGPIDFDDISWCDLLVIGSQTSTNQPWGYEAEFSPELDWVVDIINQCRAAGVPYYVKPNAGRDAPGMLLPKMLPRIK